MTALPHAAISHPIAASATSGFFSRYLREISVAIAYFALLLLLAIVRPTFFRAQFAQVIVGAAPVLVAAIGMTLVILSRQIDISIGSQWSVCGIVAGLLASNHVPVPWIVVVTVLVGVIMGAINGALVAGLGLPSIVVTLATMVIIRGTLTWLTQGAAVYCAKLQWFGASQAGGQVLIVAIAIVIFVAFALALRWLGAGRAVYAVGSDREAARLAGIHPDRVVFATFVLMGAMTGIAALLSTARLPLVYPDEGRNREMEVIAAVVVGGTAITGGSGTLFGTLIGVLLLTIIGPTLDFLGIRPEWSKAISGAIILLAVASDGLRRRARR